MKVLEFVVFWTILCFIMLPILNVVAGKRLTEGLLFVYLGGFVCLIIAGLAAFLTKVIL